VLFLFFFLLFFQKIPQETKNNNFSKFNL